MERTWTRQRGNEEGGSHREYQSDDGWLIERRGTGSKANPFYYQAAPSMFHYWVQTFDTLAAAQSWVEDHADEDFTALDSRKRRFERRATR